MLILYSMRVCVCVYSERVRRNFYLKFGTHAMPPGYDDRVAMYVKGFSQNSNLGQAPSTGTDSTLSSSRKSIIRLYRSVDTSWTR